MNTGIVVIKHSQRGALLLAPPHSPLPVIRNAIEFVTRPSEKTVYPTTPRMAAFRVRPDLIDSLR
jgi:hypothetical protein